MSKTPRAAIEIEGLSKRYPKSTEPAVDNLNLKVLAGEVYGFLGPNGAGKSTTIRMLLNFIQPSSGTAEILGQDIVKDSVPIKHAIGYLSGDVALYGKMTGSQFLSYMADLHPLRHKSELDRLTRAFKADLNVRINSLSKGNRQKIGIIQALMHEPEVLILDEPTSGLDPLMQEVFYEILAGFKKKGCAVFVSSHNLAEVQKMCDRVGIIKNGKLVSESTIADMEIAAAQTFDIDFTGKPPLELLQAAFGKNSVSAKGSRATVHVAGELAPLFKILTGHPVRHIATRELNLEDEFMHFYGEDE